MFSRHSLFALLVGLPAVCLPCRVYAQGEKSGEHALGTRTYGAFEKPALCGTSCHTDFYQQWQQAMMSQCYTHHWDEMARWEVEERRQELAAMVRENWYQLYAIDQAVTALDRSIANLDDLGQEALAANPEVKASAARWEMFTQKARAAGTFDDPMLMLGIDSGLVRDPFNLDRDMQTSKVIGISQMVPFFGKRALAREAANAEAEASRWEVEERKLELAAMVRETWYQLYFTDRSMVALERSIATLDKLVQLIGTM